MTSVVLKQDIKSALAFSGFSAGHAMLFQVFLIWGQRGLLA